MSSETLTKDTNRDTQTIETDKKETPEETEKRLRIAKKREEKRKRRNESIQKHVILEGFT